MSRPQLTAWPRTEHGKGPARRLRAAGKIPAVLYGGDADPVHLAIDPLELLKALDPLLKANTLFHLRIESDGGGEQLVMIKDTQKDAIRDDLVHVDLLRVAEDQPVNVRIPLVLTGRSEGVRLGGLLQQIYRDVPVRAQAGSIPASITVDTTSWGPNHQLRSADLPLPEGVAPLLNPKQKVAAIVAGRAEEEEEAAVEAEGEETSEQPESAAE